MNGCEGYDEPRNNPNAEAVTAWGEFCSEF